MCFTWETNKNIVTKVFEIDDKEHKKTVFVLP
jgi:hypothetical protein